MPLPRSGRSRCRWAISTRPRRSATPARRPTSSGPTRTRRPPTHRGGRVAQRATDPVGRAGDRASEAVCKPSSVPRSLAGTVIHLDRRSPGGSCGRPEGWAAHLSPVGTSRRRRVAPSYLALLRVEFAAFHPGRRSGRTRLCGTGPRLAADGRYPLPCAEELGLSSSRIGGPTRRATVRPPRWPTDSTPPRRLARQARSVPSTGQTMLPVATSSTTRAST